MTVPQRNPIARRYVDLMMMIASKWANWEPTSTIQCGDYGDIDIETGYFIKEGNLYEAPEIADLTSQYPPTLKGAEKDYKYTSVNAKEAKVKPGIKWDDDTTEGSLFCGRWQFSQARGAVLMMYQSQITKVPSELLDTLKESGWAIGKHIVEHVHTCPAYAIYISDMSKETVSIALRSDRPESAGPTGLSWVTSGATGLFRGEISADKNKYVPLYQLTEIRPRAGKRRERPDPENDDKLVYWHVDIPWDFLDDEGEEIPEDKLNDPGWDR